MMTKYESASERLTWDGLAEEVRIAKAEVLDRRREHEAAIKSLALATEALAQAEACFRQAKGDMIERALGV
jgi:hypothetical protein